MSQSTARLRLRDWLLESAGVHGDFVDGVLDKLEEEEVCTTADLRILREECLLSSILTRTTARKLCDALDAECCATASPFSTPTRLPQPPLVPAATAVLPEETTPEQPPPPRKAAPTSSTRSKAVRGLSFAAGATAPALADMCLSRLVQLQAAVRGWRVRQACARVLAARTIQRAVRDFIYGDRAWRIWQAKEDDRCDQEDRDEEYAAACCIQQAFVLLIVRCCQAAGRGQALFCLSAEQARAHVSNKLGLDLYDDEQLAALGLESAWPSAGNVKMATAWLIATARLRAAADFKQACDAKTYEQLAALGLESASAGNVKEKIEMATATTQLIGISRETAPGCSGDCTIACRSPRGPVTSSLPSHRQPWKTRPGHKPDAHLPYEFRYGVKEWGALDLYDKWLRGEQLETDEDSYDYNQEEERHNTKVMCEAGLVNYTLERIFDDAFDVRYNPTDRPLIDVRCSVESQHAAFKLRGFAAPPSTAEIMELMVKAAEWRFKDEQRLDARGTCYPTTFSEYTHACRTGHECWRPVKPLACEPVDVCPDEDEHALVFDDADGSPTWEP